MTEGDRNYGKALWEGSCVSLMTNKGQGIQLTMVCHSWRGLGKVCYSPMAFVNKSFSSMKYPSMIDPELGYAKSKVIFIARKCSIHIGGRSSIT